MVNKVLIIAHRGNSKEAPENTLASIKQAIDLGVDFVEIDIHLSADKIPVVIHDTSLRRTTGLLWQPLIHELPWEKIRHFDVGSPFNEKFKGETIPRLKDVLELEWKNTSLMIEIKKGVDSPADTIQAIEREIDLVSSPLPFFILGSFSLPLVEEAKKIVPKERLIGIVEKVHCLEGFTLAGIKRIAAWHKILSPNTLYPLLDQGIEVWSFTVDHPLKAEDLVHMGVLGIISNTPATIKEKLCTISIPKTSSGS